MRRLAERSGRFAAGEGLFFDCAQKDDMDYKYVNCGGGCGSSINE
jgi:hypothetical protein